MYIPCRAFPKKNFIFPKNGSVTRFSSQCKTISLNFQAYKSSESPTLKKIKMQFIATIICFASGHLTPVRFLRTQNVAFVSFFMWCCCFLCSPSPTLASNLETQTPYVERTCALTKNETPWGTFFPGTWVIRRTNDQRFRQGIVESNISETHLVLDEIHDNGIVLQHESIIGIGNRVYVTEAKHISLDFYQQPISEDIVIEQLTPQTVIVARRQIVCQVCRYTHVLNDEKKTTTIWYSNTVMPYLLRLEEIRTRIPSADETQETVLHHLIKNVTETSGTRLFKNVLGSYKIQTIKKTSTGTTVSRASFSTNIPGGLLREVSVERDANGKIIRQSVTSVIDYFLASPGTPIRQRRSSANDSLEIRESWDNLIQETKGDDSE